MGEKNSQSSRVCEDLLEIRYKANAKILDYRGSLAEELKNQMGLARWRITQNRVDIHDDEDKERGFVSHQNCGFVVHNAPTSNYFFERAVKLLRFLFEKKDLFDSHISVLRIGFRARSCTPFSGSFEKLVESYSTRYLSLTEQAREIIGGKLIDIGGPLNFRDKQVNFNTMSGPMKKEQMEQYFPFEDDFPEVGFYYDIDYWVKPEAPMDARAIIQHIKTFTQEAWKRYSGISELIFRS